MSGIARGVHELQILRDELDIDERAGGIFEIPGIGVALFLGDRRAHLDDIGRRSCAGRACGTARRGSTASIRAAKSGEPRDDPRARERHVLPGPGLALLIAGESRRSASPAGRSGPTAASRMSTG